MPDVDRRIFLTGLACLAGVAPAAGGGEIRLRDLYNKDQSFSALARSMEGREVAVTGFMAPPLKAESAFFVLTKMPMSVCPFCESEAEWPDDILAVYTDRVVKVVPFNVPIVTRGVLSLGVYEDPDTGFVSVTRLVDADFERL